jgi:hypothetical protein
MSVPVTIDVWPEVMNAFVVLNVTSDKVGEGLDAMWKEVFDEDAEGPWKLPLFKRLGKVQNRAKMTLGTSLNANVIEWLVAEERVGDKAGAITPEDVARLHPIGTDVFARMRNGDWGGAAAGLIMGLRGQYGFPPCRIKDARAFVDDWEFAIKGSDKQRFALQQLVNGTSSWAEFGEALTVLYGEDISDVAEALGECVARGLANMDRTEEYVREEGELQRGLLASLKPFSYLIEKETSSAMGVTEEDSEAIERGLDEIDKANSAWMHHYDAAFAVTRLYFGKSPNAVELADPVRAVTGRCGAIIRTWVHARSRGVIIRTDKISSLVLPRCHASAAQAKRALDLSGMAPREFMDNPGVEVQVEFIERWRSACPGLKLDSWQLPDRANSSPRVRQTGATCAFTAGALVEVSTTTAGDERAMEGMKASAEALCRWVASAQGEEGVLVVLEGEEGGEMEWLGRLGEIWAASGLVGNLSLRPSWAEFRGAWVNGLSVWERRLSETRSFSLDAVNASLAALAVLKQCVGKCSLQELGGAARVFSDGLPTAADPEQVRVLHPKQVLRSVPEWFRSSIEEGRGVLAVDVLKRLQPAFSAEGWGRNLSEVSGDWFARGGCLLSGVATGHEERVRGGFATMVKVNTYVPEPRAPAEPLTLEEGGLLDAAIRAASQRPWHALRAVGLVEDPCEGEERLNSTYIMCDQTWVSPGVAYSVRTLIDRGAKLYCPPSDWVGSASAASEWLRTSEKQVEGAQGWDEAGEEVDIGFEPLDWW